MAQGRELPVRQEFSITIAEYQRQQCVAEYEAEAAELKKFLENETYLRESNDKYLVSLYQAGVAVYDSCEKNKNAKNNRAYDYERMTRMLASVKNSLNDHTNVNT